MFSFAYYFILGSTVELVITGDTGSEAVDSLAAVARKAYHPGLVLLFHPAGVERKEIEALAPFLEPMVARNGKAAAYLCRDHACLPPVTGVKELTTLLKERG